MRLFKPNLTYSSYLDIDYTLLKQKGIKALFIDVDNTLVPHDQALPSPENIKFIAQLKEMEFKVFIISNNNEKRVGKFAQALAVPYYSFALKPFKKTYRKIIAEHSLSKSEIAIVGDQLLTDILGGNRMGFTTIYTKPLVIKDINFTKINRVFEKIILKRLNAKKALEIGVYYD